MLSWWNTDPLHARLWYQEYNIEVSIIAFVYSIEIY
jgi:hypothetical protein